MAIQHKETIPDNIEVRGARVNNLKNVNVDIPLNAFVAITGRSGSGNSHCFRYQWHEVATG